MKYIIFLCVVMVIADVVAAVIAVNEAIKYMCDDCPHKIPDEEGEDDEGTERHY